MIRRLRQRHASVLFALAVVVPVIFVAALAVRPELPVMPSASPPLQTESWTALDPGGSLRGLIEVRGHNEWLHLVRDERLVAPDALVYWSSEVPGDDAPFPPAAVLLGALGDTGSHTYALPARDVTGNLLVYSLAHRSVIAAAPLAQIQRTGTNR